MLHILSVNSYTTGNLPLEAFMYAKLYLWYTVHHTRIKISPNIYNQSLLYHDICLIRPHNII